MTVLMCGDVAYCFSWATCLNDAPAKTRPDLDHEARFQDEPGQSWGAKRQCEVLLRDKDATLLNPDKLQVKKKLCEVWGFHGS
jgi:hypothetical protein